MWRKVQRFMEKQGMATKGRVLVALSGGADSVCLLSVLRRISHELELRALHVHHGLRGEEADRDVMFVRNLCRQMQIPLTVVYRNVSAYALEHGLSEEEAGRLLRYEALEEEADRWEEEEVPDCRKGTADVWIALAHHKDDQAETILHHLLRGSGLSGLAGIRPVQNNRIRPLLCVSRGEIVEYLKQEGLSWCEDSTNESSDYTRNRIRNHLIPQMKEQVNRNAVENIIHAGEIAAQADDYLKKRAEEVWRQAGRERKNGGCSIRREVFGSQEPIIQTYLIRHMLGLAAPGWKDITSVHFRQLAELAGKQSGKRLDLPCGITGYCDYEELILKCEKQKNREGDFCSTVLELPEPDGPDVEVQGLKLRAFSAKKGEEIPKNQYTKWFDYDKINSTLFLRPRQSGDYLLLLGGGKKMVARYMIDEKIPRDQRDEILMLAEDSHILWVIGFRISEYYKVTNTTKTILEAKFDGGKKDGRESSCFTV